MIEELISKGKDILGSKLSGDFNLSEDKVDATIEINHLPFKTGKVRLNRVNIKNGVAVSYNIQFFGLLSSLVDKFKDDYLSDLD